MHFIIIYNQAKFPSMKTQNKSNVAGYNNTLKYVFYLYCKDKHLVIIL